MYRLSVPIASVRLLQSTLIVAFAALVAVAANAQDGVGGNPTRLDAERLRIAGERRSVEAEFAARRKACYQRFAVNDCLREARAQRRGQIAELRRQEVALNDAQRERKAAEQRRKIEQKERERARPDTAAVPAAERPPGLGATAAPTATQRATRSHPTAKPPLVPRGQSGAERAKRQSALAGQSRVERARQEQANELSNERKQREAQEHKARVLRENAAKKEPAAPLPVPPAAPVN